MTGRFYADGRMGKSARRISAKLQHAASDDGQRCAVPGCIRLTQAAAGRGLSATHCRYHVQFHNRHGSYWRGTLSKAELRPYREAARTFIKERKASPDAEAALHGVLDLLNWQRRRVNFLELRQMDTETKARAALWRLHEANVPPLTILTNHLAISAAVREEFTAGEEFRVVQIAKACLRLASGYRPDYEWAPNREHYTPSAGRLLRVFGAKLEGACGAFTACHMDAVRRRVRMARLGSLDMTAPIA